MIGDRWVYNHDADAMQLVRGKEVLMSRRPWSETDQSMIAIAMSKAARHDGGHRTATPDARSGWQHVIDAAAPNDNATFTLRRFAAKMVEALA